METNIIKVINESGVEKATANVLQESFLPFFEKANEWSKKAKQLVVTDVSQTDEMKAARKARLELRQVRINADKTRKDLKQDSLRYGKAVQGVYNVIEYLIVPIEKHLEEQEKFAEIQEANRKAEIKADRETELQPYAEFIPLGIDLAGMSDEDYSKLLSGAKLQLEARQEAEKKAERERAEKERLLKLHNERKESILDVWQFFPDNRKEECFGEISESKWKELTEEAHAKKKEFDAEQEKVKAENEKLRKEKEEAEKEAEAERAEKAKMEAKLKAQADAEAKAKQEALEAERKAEAAPDKAKLIELAKTIDALNLPELKSKEAQKILNEAKGLLVKVVDFIKDRSSKI